MNSYAVIIFKNRPRERIQMILCDTKEQTEKIKKVLEGLYGVYRVSIYKLNEANRKEN